MSALLSSYLSLLVAERLATRTTPLREPEASYALGAVMLTDIASFTGVVEKSLESREAFENLTRDFDRYFSRLVEIVYLNGGDVLTVAGDAFFCFWPAADEAQLS